MQAEESVREPLFFPSFVLKSVRFRHSDTLVIHGDADRILPITAAGLRTAKLIKGARLLVVKDGPHCIPWTHAEEVNAELLSFLGGKAGKSQTEAA
jgi:pimeloyl-ACP methyl ester carboxylesterase